MGLAERAAEDREVLAEHAHPSSVDGAEPGDHPIGPRAGVLEAHATETVAHEQVDLLERTFVEEVVDPLAGEHLALRQLRLDRSIGPRIPGFLLPLGKGVEAGGHRVIGGSRSAGGGSRRRVV